MPMMLIAQDNRPAVLTLRPVLEGHKKTVERGGDIITHNTKPNDSGLCQGI